MANDAILTGSRFMKMINALLRGEYDSGVYTVDIQADANEIRLLAEQHEYRFYYIRGDDISTKQEFLDEAKATMNFPYFGNNWDALLDCLRDLSWHPAKGYILLYDNFHIFQKNSPEDFAVALEVFNDATVSWKEASDKKIPLYILLSGERSPGKDN